MRPECESYWEKGPFTQLHGGKRITTQGKRQLARWAKYQEIRGGQMARARNAPVLQEPASGTLFGYAAIALSS